MVWWKLFFVLEDLQVRTRVSTNKKIKCKFLILNTEVIKIRPTLLNSFDIGMYCVSWNFIEKSTLTTGFSLRV